ncbi:MAG: hypothetical protein J6A01_11155 [Proteobacteria bacterium]|nr:hypothetical protein [Pseudomonadota bacterium]
MSVDIGMPVRVMGYDWTRYRYQLEKDTPLNQDTRIAPVFTHVLNFSYKYKWRWPYSLRDLVNLPPELAKFFQNYKIRVTNLAWLTHKQRACLTGDFRILVEALCEMRTKGKITGIQQPVKYIDAMLAILAATTNKQSFTLMDKTDFLEGKTTMCEIMDRWENELLSKGEKAGFANGEKASAIRILKDFGKSQSETVDYLTQNLHLTQEEAKAAIKEYW